MTVAGKVLYELLEIDIELEAVGERLAALDNAIGDRATLERLEAELTTNRELLDEQSRRQRLAEGERQALAERAEEVDGRLYGGTVTSPRELQDLSRESANLQAKLSEQEDTLLEALLQVEETQSAISVGEANLERESVAWEEAQYAMIEEREAAALQQASLTERRDNVSRAVNPGAALVYESARKSRGPAAVSRVERGLCRGCGVSLPTHSVQRARTSENPVQCDMCRSVLFVR